MLTANHNIDFQINSFLLAGSSTNVVVAPLHDEKSGLTSSHRTQTTPPIFLANRVDSTHLMSLFKDDLKIWPETNNIRPILSFN